MGISGLLEPELCLNGGILQYQENNFENTGMKEARSKSFTKEGKGICVTSSLYISTYTSRCIITQLLRLLGGRFTKSYTNCIFLAQ